MAEKLYLGVVDYIIICFALIISLGIGIASRFFGSKQTTANEYILAGRKMTKIPVMLSIIVTIVSPTTIISLPAEIYQYGFRIAIAAIVLPLGMVLALWIFIPVYFQTGVSTVNEVHAYCCLCYRCCPLLLSLLAILFNGAIYNKPWKKSD